MSSRRAERLVNLVLCLLSTRQFLTAERIRTAVPGYEPDDGTARADEAFKRMFERDKAELRELGIPLETGKTSIFDTEEGYRIARRDYELPEVSLEPDEAAAVGLAARLWQSAELADAARGALLKLRAGGVDVEPARTLDVEPRLDAAEEALHPCLDAVQAGRAVRFAYRKPSGVESDREVEPWGVVSWRGRWYLVGHDRDRGAPRCFRLSRVLGAVSPVGHEGAVKVPTGIDLVGHVVATEPPEYHRFARVRVRRGQGIWLRKIAARIEPGERGSDWDVAEIGYDDPEWIADRVARQGSGAVVDEPIEVREAVVRRLRAHAAPGRPASAGRGPATGASAGGPARPGSSAGPRGSAAVVSSAAAGSPAAASCAGGESGAAGPGGAGGLTRTGGAGCADEAGDADGSGCASDAGGRVGPGADDRAAAAVEGRR